MMKRAPLSEREQTAMVLACKFFKSAKITKAGISVRSDDAIYKAQHVIDLAHIVALVANKPVKVLGRWDVANGGEVLVCLPDERRASKACGRWGLDLKTRMLEHQYQALELMNEGAVLGMVHDLLCTAPKPTPSKPEVSPSTRTNRVVN